MVEKKNLSEKRIIRREEQHEEPNFRVPRINKPPFPSVTRASCLAVQERGKIPVGPSNSTETCNPLEMILDGTNGTDMELIMYLVWRARNPLISVRGVGYL
ncbi:hypothetical protein DMUE_0851 [Dictyocoela muelleri]|nr:hypothetical protein DMUE_0851 [Dictyocoela muelleri]